MSCQILFSQKNNFNYLLIGMCMVVTSLNGILSRNVWNLFFYCIYFDKLA